MLLLFCRYYYKYIFHEFPELLYRFTTQTLFPLYSLALCENDLSFHFFKLTIPVVCFNFFIKSGIVCFFQLKRRRSKKIRKTIFRFLSYTIFFLLTEFFSDTYRSVPERCSNYLPAQNILK